jgi:hypothetical protein
MVGWRPSPPSCSDLSRFGQRQGIFHFYAKVSNRRLDFGVTKQDLHCAQIACLLVDQGCLVRRREWVP